MRKLKFSLFSPGVVVCRLEPDAALPEWATRGAFFSVTRTKEELSIVCAEEQVPAGVQHSGRFVALKLQGPFAFSETGVVSSFVAPLAEAGVPVFVVSTFDTDYVLVPEEAWGWALSVLKQAGHEIVS
ncbi:MAG TPA: ACT domain-containing protein [Terriglobales bacterium]|nr:ACT domain-containing protein [Terriglobales bacterium]